MLKCLFARSVVGAIWQSQWSPLKSSVPAARQNLRHKHRHRFGINRDQAAIEKSVQVRPQKQTIVDDVRGSTTVRHNVCGLQHVADRTTANGAFPTVGSNQSIPESSLAASLGDRARDPFACVLDAIGIKRLIVRIP